MASVMAWRVMAGSLYFLLSQSPSNKSVVPLMRPARPCEKGQSWRNSMLLLSWLKPMQLPS